VEQALEERHGGVASVNKFGFGLGLLGLVGVEVPLGATVAAFAEGRASVDLQLTNLSDSSDDSGDIGVENLGGVTGIGGIRIRF
jgi:hypothetical protein